MVHWHIKETLNLVCVQVHCNHSVHSGSTQQVGHQLSAYANTWFVLAVLSCPSEVWDNGIDGAGRGALGCIDHQQQLHQIVAVGECALHQEDVASANTFLVRYSKLSIREFSDLQLS